MTTPTQMTMTPALTAELRHAATIVRDAVAGTHPADATAIASAHNTLTQRRPDTRDPVRAAIDDYLDDNTWRLWGRRCRRSANGRCGQRR